MMNTPKIKASTGEFPNKKGLEEYIEKLRQLPPLQDKKTEERLRALANAVLDRIEDDDKSDKLKGGQYEQNCKN